MPTKKRGRPVEENPKNIRLDIRITKEELSNILHQQIAAGQETEQIRKEGEAIRQEVPTEVVKSRFLKLNSEHIGYVMDSLKSNTAKIGNIKAYTLAALYNAPVTMGQYYTSLVSHDMAHGLLDG